MLYKFISCLFFYKPTRKIKYEFIGDVVMDSNIREFYIHKEPNWTYDIRRYHYITFQIKIMEELNEFYSNTNMQFI